MYVSLSHVQLFATPLSMGFFSGKNTGVGCHFSSSRGSSRSRNQTCVSYVSCISRWILYPLNRWESPSVPWMLCKEYICLLWPETVLIQSCYQVKMFGLVLISLRNTRNLKLKKLCEMATIFSFFKFRDKPNWIYLIKQIISLQV